ncbi:hypothetical protein [uncultured Zoogloea sp.]|uniref:hypothetical protein n=1 Tax=uncultured Zoogloea sp. TaxID=160237 RepID=UPI0026130B6A|nr:hypothetical protein [uncultured Zoogloea sp.]
MPRPPKNIDLQPAFATTDEALHAGHTETLSREADLVAIKRGLSDDRDLVNQLLGQVQMARSFARFADVVSLTKLKHIKETKMYRALAGKKAFDPDGNEIADVGTFDGFCQALGLSRSKVDEDLTNLTAFGEEAMKSLSAIGIGYRELRQYRRLPEDQKSALIEAAKSGDKDSFLELAEDLIAKHAREKEEAQRQIEELKAEEKAKEELLADKNKLLDAERAKVKRIQAAPADERLDQLRKEITSIADDARGAIIGQLRAGLAALQDHHRDAGGDSDLWAAGVVGQLFKDLTIIRDEFGIPDLAGAEVPEWLAK